MPPHPLPRGGNEGVMPLSAPAPRPGCTRGYGRRHHSAAVIHKAILSTLLLTRRHIRCTHGLVAGGRLAPVVAVAVVVVVAITAVATTWRAWPLATGDRRICSRR
jgi:hypothetical protein